MRIRSVASRLRRWRRIGSNSVATAPEHTTASRAPFALTGTDTDTNPGTDDVGERFGFASLEYVLPRLAASRHLD